MKTYFKILNVIIVVFFLGLLLLPSINANFNLIVLEKGHENRTKATKPEFKDTLIEKYVKEYDDYYTDNFNLRENFIKFLNQFEYSAFGVSAVPKEVLVGKDGWFYERKSEANYKGINIFTEDEMARIKKELAARTKWAANRGIKYYVAVVPNKMDVYPEFLPARVIKVSDKTRYDQIVGLSDDATINIIDIRKNLLLHKKDGKYLFQHTDDHWNELGAFYGYEQIMNRLSKDFPELKPMPLSDFNMNIIERYGNMAGMIDEEKNYPEQFIELTAKGQVYGYEGPKSGYKTSPRISDAEFEYVRLNDNGKKLKLLVIRDSFTLLMIKWFQEHFKKSVFIHDEWRYRMREDIILKEKPDIVINVILETELHRLLEFPFLLDPNQAPEQTVNLQAFNGKYVCIDDKHIAIANRDRPALWETLTIVKHEGNKCSLISHDNFFLSAEIDNIGEILANREQSGTWETFELIELSEGFVAFKAVNGKYLSVNEQSSQLFANGETIGKSEKFKVVPKNK